MSAERLRKERYRLNEKVCLRLQKQSHGESGLRPLPYDKKNQPEEMIFLAGSFLRYFAGTMVPLNFSSMNFFTALEWKRAAIFL